MDLQRLIGSQAWDDLCEKFVEQATYGKAGMFSNAITAWTSQQPHAKTGLQGIQPGDTVYFSPNEGNGYNGHAGIYQGNGQFLSATDNGVQLNDLAQWAKSTGQQILGYIPTSNPQLKNQLSMLHPGVGNTPTQQAGSMGPATVLGQADMQQQQDQQAQMQQRIQDAQNASNWFQQYQQQQQQQEMPQAPRQATAYTPSVAAQPTASEQWLKQYTG